MESREEADEEGYDVCNKPRADRKKVERMEGSARSCGKARPFITHQPQRDQCDLHSMHTPSGHSVL